MHSEPPLKRAQRLVKKYGDVSDESKLSAKQISEISNISAKKQGSPKN